MVDLDPVRLELAGQPLVGSAGTSSALADQDVAGMGDLVGQGVLGGEPASVVGLGDPVALHPALADAAERGSVEGVGAAGGAGLVLAGAVPAARTRAGPG